MLVIAVALLAVFALIPILASVTAEYTHTPLQGVILTDAFVVPNQETKGQYAMQSSWYAIRHAERQQLDMLSDNPYNLFHTRINAGMLSNSTLGTLTDSYLKTYLDTPNAKASIGPYTNTGVNNGSWDKQPDTQDYDIQTYYNLNGKLIDLMPTPTTNSYFDSTTDEYGNSRGGYTVPFHLNTHNVVFHYAFPYLVRNDRLVDVIEDVGKPGGVYDTATFSSFTSYNMDYGSSNSVQYPSKTDLLSYLNNQILTELASAEYTYNNHHFDLRFDEIEFELSTDLVGDDWQVTSSSLNTRCDWIWYVSGSSQKHSYWVGVPPNRHRVIYYTCVNKGGGYIRRSSGDLYGDYRLTLDDVTATSRERNGETICDNNGLRVPEITQVTQPNDKILPERPTWHLHYGTTSSPTHTNSYTSGCSFSAFTAYSCGACPYPVWWYNWPTIVNAMSSGGPVHYTSGSATRTW